MSLSLHEKGKPKPKHKLLFLPLPKDTALAMTVVFIYIILACLILKYLWPLAIGFSIIYLIIKFVTNTDYKIVSICIVAIISIIFGYSWLQKVSADGNIRKEQRAIELSIKKEQEQKDNALKAQQEAETQKNKAEADAANLAAQAEATAKAKEQLVNDLAPVCVRDHKSLFKLKIQESLEGTTFVPQSTTRKGAYTSDECKQIITGLYDKGYSQEDIRRVAEAKFWVGMSAELLYFSLGMPNDYSNSTTTMFGTSSQLVYGNPLYGATYIYVDNGIVTSFQN